MEVAPHAIGSCGRFAASDAERVADTVAALTDPDVDIVLCARGGYGLQRIIDRIDRAIVGAKRLPLVVGFSDITELHSLMSTYQTPSLHAIMCKHIASYDESAEPLRLLLRALEGNLPAYTLPVHPLNRSGRAEGVLVGGNLSVLYGLQGTPYGLTAPRGGDEVGRILFIEDIAERHYHIDRMMNNLRLSGVLAGLSGLVVGQFSDCEDDSTMGETIYQTIRRAVDDYDYPVLFDFPAGHVERNLPLLLNAPVQLNISSDYATLGWK